MKTSVTLAQLSDPGVAESERILRTCVHRGFCTAACPSYVLLGDELDSARGRIYLIKDMLENDRPATREVVKHIDRCLSCLACMTTCPSGVHSMHLFARARVPIARTYRRRWHERLLWSLLARVMPYPVRFRALLKSAFIFRYLGPALAAVGWTSLAAMLRLIPARRRSALRRRARGALPVAKRTARVALLSGRANEAVGPGINEATTSGLNRHGAEVVRPERAGCCGALTWHLGCERESLDFVRCNIDTFGREIDGEGIDAIVITASGCGTLVKDYGFMLRNDQLYAKRAERESRCTDHISEYLMMLELRPVRETNLLVAYHGPCSLQHGQKINREPKQSLARAGFVVGDIPEGHRCCGSAGTYNMLQPALVRRLAERKAENIAKLAPRVIATGNLGCMTQLATVTDIPIVHTVELIDWATGSPLPDALRTTVVEERTGLLAPVT
jgi:glycolate oxidase iron-sulfur subunit